MPPLQVVQALDLFWQTTAEPSQKVLVAVSGGPDSLALLHALVQSGPRYPGLNLRVGHLNHLMRGENAATDANFVADFCRAARVPCHLGAFDVPSFAAQAGLSPEDAARRVRYAFLASLAAEHECSLILVAHTADDQAETVLLRLLRGTGPHGLAGMATLAPLPPLDPLLAPSFRVPPHTLRLGRPLLAVWRREIEAYCAEQSLTPRQDETNRQTDYRRNQVRLQLIPQIETVYQPNFKANLTRLAELTRAEQEWLNKLTEAEFTAHVRHQPRQISFDPAYFAAQPQALQRRLVRMAARRLKDLQNIEADHIEATIELFLAAQPRRIDLPGGLVAFRADHEAGLRLPSDPLWPATSLEIEAPFTLIGGEGAWELEARIVEAVAMQPFPAQADHYRASLDYDKIGAVIEIRPRRDGERYRPLGAPGRRKVQDVMLDAHIPAELRAVWPILVRPANQTDNQPDEICWIPGAAIANNFRVTEKTKRIYDLRFTIRKY